MISKKGRNIIGREGFLILCNNCGARFVLSDKNINRSEWKNYKKEFVKEKRGEIFVDYGNAGGYGILEIECLICGQTITGSE